MPVELVGIMSHRLSSERVPVPPKVFDRQLASMYAQAQEQAGYDRVLVAQSSFWPDSMPLATYVTSVTDTLGVMVAHRPGFVAPTMAARMFATLDHLSGGRAGIHIITAANDKETRCDGDFLTKEERYRRSREFVGILRGMWGTETPISHEGEFYRFENALSELRPFAGSALPIYWAGSSDLAIRFAGECADIYAFSLNGLADSAALLDRVKESAATAGRMITGQGTVRVILGDTEGQAWDNARAILERVIANGQDRLRLTGSAAPLVSGGRREADLAGSVNASGADRFARLTGSDAVLDSGLWVGPQKEGIPMAPALVGTPTQVVAALLRFYRMGVTGFLMRGFDLLEDAVDHGRELIPRLRIAVAEEDARMAADTAHG
jgi:alkanesulfonate monooxygenase